MISKTKLVMFVSITALLIASGCTLIRKSTYPPDFTYLERKTVTTSMQHLAMSIDKIDRTLQSINQVPTQAERDIIINELNKMVKISDDLGAGTQRTNHLLIDENIDRFKSDVISIRQSIEAEQLNYYLTGKLIGSCAGCHLLRHDDFILSN